MDGDPTRARAMPSPACKRNGATGTATQGARNVKPKRVFSTGAFCWPVLLFFSVLFLCLSLPVGSRAREEESYEFIVIKKARRQTRVAVPAFRAIAEFSPEEETLRQATDFMREAVRMVGLFELVPPDSYPNPVTAGRGFEYPPWKLIRADLVIKGEIARLGQDRYQAEFRCYDVRQEEMILGKRYTGTRDLISRMALRYADELIEWLTGRKGSLDASIAYVTNSSGRNEIYIMDTDGAHARPLTRNRTLNLSPSFSPGGRYLVYTGYRERNPDLYVADLSEKKVWLYLSKEGLNMSPEFSPDGRMIAFASKWGGRNLDIYAMSVNGKNKRRLTTAASDELSPAWSPDGKFLAFVSNRTGAPQIYLLDLSRGPESAWNPAVRLTTEGSYNTSPAWSPDGRWIAYSGRVSGQFDLFLIDMGAKGNPVTRLTATVSNEETPAWSPDGLFLAYSSNKYGNYDIYVMSVYGGEPRRLTTGTSNDRMPAWSPRGVH